MDSFNTADYFVTVVQAEWAALGLESKAIDLKGMVVVAFDFPAGLAAGDVSFKTAATIDGTYKPIDISAVTIAANNVVCVDPVKSIAMRFIKVVSTVNQAAGAKVGLRVRPAQ